MVFKIKELKAELKILLKRMKKAEEHCLDSVRAYILYDSLQTKCDKLAKKIYTQQINSITSKK